MEPEKTELFDIRVPPPIPLSFQLADAAENPIVHAIVRVFTQLTLPNNQKVPVEIGTGMTSANGLVEILLAQEPP